MLTHLHIALFQASRICQLQRLKLENPTDNLVKQTATKQVDESCLSKMPDEVAASSKARKTILAVKTWPFPSKLDACKLLSPMINAVRNVTALSYLACLFWCHWNVSEGNSLSTDCMVANPLFQRSFFKSAPRLNRGQKWVYFSRRLPKHCLPEPWRLRWLLKGLPLRGLQSVSVPVGSQEPRFAFLQQQNACSQTQDPQKWQHSSCSDFYFHALKTVADLKSLST